MLSRITTFGVTSRAARYASMHGAEIASLQEQISSGMKLTRPSQNPLAFRQATALQGQLLSLQSSENIISDATTKLNISVSQLTEFADILGSAQRLAQQGVQSVDQSERNALAVEADQLLVRLEQIANAKYADQYMYSGTKSDTKPFDFSVPSVAGGTLSTKYNGASIAGKSVISPGVSVETLYSGDELFSDFRRSETLIMGPMGAKVGAGADTIVGRATLQIRHGSTSYLGASGIQAGASSAASDNIIGPAGRHTITINDTSGAGTSGTISLNGGPAITWDSSMTNLEVKSDQGDKIFVDMSSIAAGFSGSVDIESTGTLSVDGGRTQTAIDFSASQRVTDSTTDRFVNIDSSEIGRVGDNFLEFPGTSNAFQAVYELIQDLRGGRELSSGELSNTLNRRVGDLKHLSDVVLENMGVQAASLSALDTIESQNSNLQVEVESQLSRLQSTDISEAVLRLQNAQMLQEFTYTVTAKIMSQSLVNFLR